MTTKISVEAMQKTQRCFGNTKRKTKKKKILFSLFISMLNLLCIIRCSIFINNGTSISDMFTSIYKTTLKTPPIFITHNQA